MNADTGAITGADLLHALSCDLPNGGAQRIVSLSARHLETLRALVKEAGWIAQERAVRSLVGEDVVWEQARFDIPRTCPVCLKPAELRLHSVDDRRYLCCGECWQRGPVISEAIADAP